MPTQPGLPLALALVVLLVLAVAASFVGRLHQQTKIATAAGRALLQLALVSLVITAVLSHVAWSALFALVMFGVAVFTTTRRIGAPRAWPWAALAMACGLVPTLTVIFVSGAVPWTGASLVPIAGIVIGNTMTAHSLTGRRTFAALRDEHGSYEAALSLGLTRAEAIGEVIERHLPEALVPGMDQTRTVGLVTLPGAFVGVLLGGGSPLQAGAAQLLVLVGLLAAQTITVVVADRLIRSGRLLPADLQASLRV
ncbi:putative ABC transport system permease protein [Friedmanniella endophytica]|uniref:Putative ABC transport system permease protein n=1 Tax=Microlunatus kandeliicorticis TaxID=1759536 RepID=A0A7W3IV22_9ACTN|nr:putative ABC transport system permease protein [Microlunatus kandeliicorticis]